MISTQSITINCNKSSPSAPILILSKLKQGISINWDPKTGLEIINKDGQAINFNSVYSICRFVVRTIAPELYGSTILEKTEVDHWLEFCGRRYTAAEFRGALQKIDSALSTVSYLVGDVLTLADVCVWTLLCDHKQFQKENSATLTNVKRWFNFLGAREEFKAAQEILKFEDNPKFKDSEVKVKGEDVGKFVDLPGAEMGKVIVRFPPEASGFLHIGHAKAALLNAYYQTSFQGKLVLRFDDTNPEKEKEDFEKVILEDVAMLQIKPDVFTYTSDHFDLILSKVEELLKKGKAYVDDTDPETMKNEREQRSESKNRNNEAAKNWKMWEEMKSGTDYGKGCCVRAKIDMKSDNGCMRDPTLYRCKATPHPRLSNKYKVYPTYDFACPIVDSVEGITHALRTTEYHDRDEQYFWVLDALQLRKPYIYEYSRLNMTNTVLSKRKLTWFVSEGIVDGWDDPRMPTVRGVLRRGMTVEGLKQFIVAQGSSRSVVVMEWDKIWAFNKKIIDPIAPRYNAVEKDNHVPVFVENAAKSILKVAKHPKNSDLGMKDVAVGPKLLVDRVDADQMKVNENVTFINWGNLTVVDIKKEPSGRIESIHAKLNLENKDYKKTLKVTWVVDCEDNSLVPCTCVYYDHLISKPILGKDDDFKNFMNKSTKNVVNMLGDSDLASLKKGDIIQIQRKGFFICDEPYDPSTLRYTSCAGPVVLFFIPDGSKDTAVLPEAVKKVFIKPQTPSKKIRVELNVSKLRDSSKIQSDLFQQVKAQGDAVRQLKSNKAEKNIVDAAVKELLGLKNEFKTVTGMDWKPDLESEAQNKAEKTKIDLSPSKELKMQGSSNVHSDLFLKVKNQGDAVRQLKSSKAEKSVIEAAVKELLRLKTEFKTVTGTDWKPDLKLEAQNEPEKTKIGLSPSKELNVQGSSNVQSDLFLKVKVQGDAVRQLKSGKAEKSVIDAAVKELLRLKNEFKTVTGMDWKPDLKFETQHEPEKTKIEVCVSKDSAIQNSSNVQSDLFLKVKNQGDAVRQLKSSKAEKNAIDAAVTELLRLKGEFKTATGMDWKPDLKFEAQLKPEDSNVQVNNDSSDNYQDFEASYTESSDASADLDEQIRAQGDLVRKLKSDKASKDIIDENVKTLLKLKENYKNVSGKDWKPDPSDSKKVPKHPNVEKQKKQPTKGKANDKVTSDTMESSEGGLKKITRLGMEAKKEENLADWYSQILTKAEMIDYYDISGCYILRPWAFGIWEAIQKFLDESIKVLGVTNCYFPMFVSQSALEREKTHIADFAPEVAWVTKSGSSDLEKPIAVRPTSETVMYPSYAKWIRSHRDLPLRLNQWCNVVRWEFKNPQPFIRTREFLWQEGHTAFANKEDAVKEVHKILDLYALVYQYLLAIPVIKGRKTEKEKFAGADFTTTVEAFIPACGRGLQGATSHHLGQNFSKMFEIVFEDPETNEKKYVYQNSWGMTTRTIGAMVMIHADNTGLVLPPRVAAHQVVIVPCGITASMKESEKESLLNKCKEFESVLHRAKVLVKGDYRDNYSPGWKFNDWELKGVPIRVEIGPKDLKKDQFVAVRRDTGEKTILTMASAPNSILELLDQIQESLFSNAKRELDSHLIVSYDWQEFCAKLDERCIIQAPFCGEIECEDKIKKDSAKTGDELADSGAPSMGAKSLCIPFEQPAEIKKDTKCIYPSCQNMPKYFTLFGRSY